MSIRCFVAAELDETIRKQIAQLQDRLRRKLPPDTTSLKWVKPENIHLTLKFLGEVDDNLIDDICTAVSETTRRFDSFDFEIADCGCFGSSSSARVLWVGVKEANDKLAELARAVDKALATLRFPRERRKFGGHLTLARIRSSKSGRLVRDVVQNLEPISLGSQNVSQLTVFQSDLTRSGPIYTPLHHAPLGS